jgi:hypothetical protein
MKLLRRVGAPGGSQAAVVLYVAGNAFAAKSVMQRTFLLLRIGGLRGYFDAKSKRRPI